VIAELQEWKQTAGQLQQVEVDLGILVDVAEGRYRMLVEAVQALFHKVHPIETKLLVKIAAYTLRSEAVFESNDWIAECYTAQHWCCTSGLKCHDIHKTQKKPVSPATACHTFGERQISCHLIPATVYTE
jgi:hypothetical protein